MRKDFSIRWKKYKPIYLLLLLQFFSLFLFAQTRVTGKVTDAENRGIPDISVTLRNTTSGTTTDADGNYSLQTNVRSGTYDLVFFGSRIQSGDPVRATGYISH